MSNRKLLEHPNTVYGVGTVQEELGCAVQLRERTLWLPIGFAWILILQVTRRAENIFPRAVWVKGLVFRL